MKPKVYLIYPGDPINGGAPAVAVWSVVALRYDYDVRVVSCVDWPLVELNAFFGTDLKEGDFTLIRIHPLPWLGSFYEKLPRTLKLNLFSRWVKCNLDEGLCVSMCGEFDFGRPGIQYIHFPFYSNGTVSTYERASIGCKDSLFKRIYRRWAERMSGWSLDSIRENETLCNSAYTASVTEEVYGCECQVVNPPVEVAGWPKRAWSERKNAVVMLGRIISYKRQDLGIEAIRKLRELGYDLEFYIVGHWDDDTAYNTKIKALESECDWLHVYADVSRVKLMDLVTACKYAIHGMDGEHFGIAVVELMAAGCIPFVPNQGGQAEIVQEQSEYLWYEPGNVPDLIRAMRRVLDSESNQSELAGFVYAAAQCYGVNLFSDKIRQHVLNSIRDKV